MIPRLLWQRYALRTLCTGLVAVIALLAAVGHAQQPKTGSKTPAAAPNAKPKPTVKLKTHDPHRVGDRVVVEIQATVARQ